jgi:hypothetical protein
MNWLEVGGYVVGIIVTLIIVLYAYFAWAVREFYHQLSQERLALHGPPIVMSRAELQASLHETIAVRMYSRAPGGPFVMLVSMLVFAYT